MCIVICVNLFEFFGSASDIALVQKGALMWCVDDLLFVGGGVSSVRVLD